jgi:hypothetical protein
MVCLQVDDGWSLADLAHLVEPVEIVAADGKLIGLFVPANLERGREIYAHLAATTDAAELERRASSGARCFTSEEVAAHLLALERNGPAASGTARSQEDRPEQNECATP